jgi:hypothetical protein
MSLIEIWHTVDMLGFGRAGVTPCWRSGLARTLRRAQSIRGGRKVVPELEMGLCAEPPPIRAILPYGILSANRTHTTLVTKPPLHGDRLARSKEES